MYAHTHPDWPVQVRLPGQAAAPEGPVDMTMMYVSHHGFRRDLGRFTEAVRRTPVEDRATWRLLGRRWAVFTELLHGHHGAEDAGVWPWLLAHGTEEDRVLLEAMEAEHGEIDPLLAHCAEGFDRLCHHADEDARAALAVRLVATRDSLGRHLAHEESEAIALIQRLMTAEDWQRLDEEFMAKQLTTREIVQLVPWAAHELPRDVLDRVLDDVGFGFRLVWLATRRRFAAREARIFCHRGDQAT